MKGNWKDRGYSKCIKNIQKLKRKLRRSGKNRSRSSWWTKLPDLASSNPKSGGYLARGVLQKWASSSTSINASIPIKSRNSSSKSSNRPKTSKTCRKRLPRHSSSWRNRNSRTSFLCFTEWTPILTASSASTRCTSSFWIKVSFKLCSPCCSPSTRATNTETSIASANWWVPFTQSCQSMIGICCFRRRKRLIATPILLLSLKLTKHPADSQTSSKEIWCSNLIKTTFQEINSRHSIISKAERPINHLPFRELTPKSLCQSILNYNNPEPIYFTMLRHRKILGYLTTL